MKNRFDTSLFAIALCALALAACVSDAASPSVTSTPVARAHAYRYEGQAGLGQVTRTQAVDGVEALRGTLEVSSPRVNSERPRSTETVTLDAHGLLRQAEIVIETAGARASYTLYPSRGVVHIERMGSAPVEWAVPSDAPWVYAPAASGEGNLVVSPVAAWVAFRAARSAPVVRVLQPEQQRSYLAPIDQVVVPTERGATVTFGYDGVDVDDQFISELRLSRGLVLLSRSDLGA